MTSKMGRMTTHQSKGICSMYRPDAYPTNDKDPRLFNVNNNVTQLRKIISDKEWHDKDCQREREELSVLLSAVKEGILWLPRF